MLIESIGGHVHGGAKPLEVDGGRRALCMQQFDAERSKESRSVTYEYRVSVASHRSTDH